MSLRKPAPPLDASLVRAASRASLRQHAGRRSATRPCTRIVGEPSTRLHGELIRGLSSGRDFAAAAVQIVRPGMSTSARSLRADTEDQGASTPKQGTASFRNRADIDEIEKISRATHRITVASGQAAWTDAAIAVENSSKRKPIDGRATSERPGSTTPKLPAAKSTQRFDDDLRRPKGGYHGEAVTSGRSSCCAALDMAHSFTLAPLPSPTERRF